MGAPTPFFGLLQQPQRAVDVAAGFLEGGCPAGGVAGGLELVGFGVRRGGLVQGALDLGGELAGDRRVPGAGILGVLLAGSVGVVGELSPEAPRTSSMASSRVRPMPTKSPYDTSTNCRVRGDVWSREA